MKKMGKLLADNLKDIRKAQGLTQEGLAELADCSLSTVRSVEIARMWPSLDIVEKLAKALKVQESRLFFDPSNNSAEMILEYVRKNLETKTPRKK